jgi:hypothetical protein
MSLSRIGLIGLSALTLTATATVALAQQALPTPNPVFNSVQSGSSTLLPQQSEIPVSPALPATGSGVLTNTTPGTNPLTGLPCSGPGSLSVSGAGSLPGSTEAPLNGSTIGSTTTPTIPSFPSVFGSANTSGAC